mmetsp:Transcript_4871/g.9762  ORF Transcript_4871/g.9762 Transcript_4871/m.9762 type:complete len:121 (-) Transcript_4871:346-708(-)
MGNGKGGFERGAREGGGAALEKRGKTLSGRAEEEAEAEEQEDAEALAETGNAPVDQVDPHGSSVWERPSKSAGGALSRDATTPAVSKCEDAAESAGALYGDVATPAGSKCEDAAPSAGAQ